MVTRRVSEGNNVFRFRRLRMIGNCFPLAHEELSWIVVSQYKPEAQASELSRMLTRLRFGFVMLSHRDNGSPKNQVKVQAYSVP